MLKKTTMNFSRFILCFALLILGSGSLLGQVSGIKTIPTDYATIADFITDINTNGIGSGGVTLNVPSGYTETAPAGGFSITATGTVANPIVIQGAGGAPKPIITASAALTSGALNDAVIKLIGSDYVTISGLDLRENAANTTTASATNNMTEFGIALFYSTTTDGCQNVSITDNTIGLGATYQNAMGIYANSTHTATVVNTGATATTGNNNNLTIKRNTISSVNLGIVVLGPTAAVDHASGLTIGGAPGDGNTITFGLSGTFSGFNAVSGTVNGILFRNVKNTNCSYNTLNSNGTVTAGTLNGIQLQAFSNTPVGTFSQVISNNTFNLTSAAVGGSVVGITSPSGSASPTSTLDISNNQFNAFGHSVASPTGSLTFISTVSTNFTTTISNNSFNNLTVTTTGSVTFVSHSFTIPAGGSSTASGNSIVTQFTKSGAGGSVTGFTTGASSPNSAFYTLSNNNFSNISVTGATSLTFISNSDGSGSACSKTVTGNTFSNITGGTSAITGFSTSYWGGAASTVANNTFSNITGQGSISAIILTNSFAGSVASSIQNNTISSLSSTGAGSTVTGISSSNTATSIAIAQNNINTLSSTGASLVSAISISGASLTNVSANRIYGLSSSNAGGTVFGISITGGTGVNVSNNVISGLTAPIASGVDVIRGINVNSSSNGAVYGVYYNSVYLSGTSSGTNFGTSGIYHQVNATATTAALDMRNNIIINETTPVGTGIAVAFRRSGIALNNYSSNSNRNLFYAGTPSATSLIMFDGTNAYQTILAYQAAVLPKDANSITGEATFTGAGFGTAGNFFISLNGASTDFLRPVAGITTQVEAGAATISGITTDYTGATRSSTPDMGAYEFSGTTPAPIITLNSVTPPVSSECVASDRLVSANITTSSGTITGATIGYSVNGVPQTNIVMTNISGSTWEGTIPASTPGNATIEWGIVATNSIGLNASYSGTTYADEPLTGAVASATSSLSPVCASSPSVLTAKLIKNGPITIGTGSTISTGSAAQTPFYGGYGGVKTQYLIRASELTALGLNAGNITQMSLNITSAGSTLSGFGISMDHTALTALTTNIENVATPVYSAASFVPIVGTNNFVFSTPFNWDGISNVIVSFCWSNNNTSNTVSNLSIVSTAYASGNARYVDSKTATEVCGYIGNTTPSGWNGGATTITSRPIFTFNGNATQTIAAISWSDGVGTVGTTNPLTVNPTATTTYTATITAAGCTFSPSPSTTITVNPLPSAPTATNSAQCGVQIPTASVTSTTGEVTPTFNWYAAPTGGSALQSSTSVTYTSTVAATTTFYVSELNSVTGCESVRTPVTVNVSTPDQVSLTPSVPAICLGESVTLTASNTNPTPFQSYAYSTESATTGSGAETPIAGASISVTPTASGTYTYTVTGVDGGCAASATASVTVNSLPVISTATATPATVCSGDPITLTGASVIVNPGTAPIGTQTTTEFGGSVYRNGFGTGDFRHQLVFTAAELAAAGIQAGDITAISFNVTSAGSGSANNYTIKLGNTSATATTATFLTDPTSTVYNAATYTAVAGVNTHTFATPFNWNGTSNILIEICYNISSTGGTSTVAATTPASARNSNLLGTANACTVATGTTFANRPLVTFTAQVGTNLASSLNWSWTPGTGLNTAVASTSVLNTTGSSMSQAFTVTATNPTTGCVNTAVTSPVTINAAPATPVANNSTQCGLGVPSASVTGTGTPGNTFSWYLTPTGGTALAGETGSTLSAYSITTTTTFYVAENNGTCSSTRTSVTATVTAPPAITVSGLATICDGTSTVLTVSSPNDPNYTYTWSGGLGTGATVNASPTANTTYTITATDASGGANNGCVNSTNYAVSVNPSPTAVTANSSATTICNGSTINLTSSADANTSVLDTLTEGLETFPPSGWSMINAGSGNAWTTSALAAHTGSAGMAYVYNASFAGNAWAISPQLNMVAGQTYSISFWYKVRGASFPEKLKVTVGNAATVPAQTTILWDNNGGTSLTNTTWVQGTTSYTPTVSGNYYVGFNCYSDADEFELHVDDISIQYTAPGAAPTYAWTSSPAGFTSSVQNPTNVAPAVSTIYTVTATNSFGCSNTASVNVVVNEPTASTVTETACTSYTWPQNGTTYLVSGMYTDIIPNAAGCDSVITLDLTINQATASSVSEVACTSYTWAQTGATYTVSGAYTDTIPNSIGCDSIITLNLTINSVTTSSETVSTCNPSYTWAQNGMTYTVSGAYTDTIPNTAGCDSIITLNLTITPFVATATDNGDATITASAGTTYQWINCTTNTAIAGATSQTFTATANGSYAVVVSNGTCSDTSACVTIANVGIKENLVSTISVHPNPTHDVVIVTMDAVSAIVEVMDVQGKLVQTTQIKSGDQVDLSTYERGVYTLRIKTEFGTSLERIVKN